MNISFQRIIFVVPGPTDFITGILKARAMIKHGIELLYDDNQDIVNAVKEHGLKAVRWQ